MKKYSLPIRVGLVGLGVLSQRSLLPHLVLADSKEKIHLEVVCDHDEQRARLTAETFSIPKYFTSITEMLEKSKIDAVLICTPASAHYENIMECLRDGKHVYVQKPLAPTSDQAYRALKNAIDNKLSLVASPIQILNPARQTAQRFINEGKLGSVYWAICAINAKGHEYEKARQGEDPLTNIDPSWYYLRGGGPVFNMTVYALHTLTSLFGPVKKVSGFSGLRNPIRYWKGKPIHSEVDDNTLLLLDFGDNLFAMTNGSTAVGSQFIPWGHLSIFGSDNSMSIYSTYSNEPNLANVIEMTEGEKIIINDFGQFLSGEHITLGDPHVFADVMFFIDCVSSGRECYEFAAQACHVIEVIEKGYESALNGKAMSIQNLPNNFIFNKGEKNEN